MLLSANAFGQVTSTSRPLDSDDSIIRFLPDDVIGVVGMQPSQVLNHPDIQTFLEATTLQDKLNDWDAVIGLPLAVKPSDTKQVLIFLDHSTILAAIQNLWASARESEYRNQLRNLGLAMHLAAGKNGILIDDDGPVGNFKGNLSWRVWLLPHLDEQELFDQFHLDESWDSDHNRTLIKQMPKCFETLQSKAEGKTSILVFHGCRK
ncbi:MAG: DUF1559 domain-containing protein [Planctomycetota bacterium]|nr:DUF1559 domain-containing protein [Planctomycetota bacterium]